MKLLTSSARAREENARIRKEERKAQKVANVKAGIIDPIDDDSDSDDEDWDEDAPSKHQISISEDEEADDEIELSGSEDEGMDEEVDGVGNDVVDDAACESENDEDEEMGEAEAADLIIDNDEDEEVTPTLASAASRRRSRKSAIIDSDDEVDDVTPTISVQNTPPAHPPTAKTPGSVTFLGKSPAVPTSVLPSATKSFNPGIPVNGAFGLGLTQIFRAPWIARLILTEVLCRRRVKVRLTVSKTH